MKGRHEGRRHRSAEVKIVEPQVFGDDRGFFLESWNARSFAGAGIDAAFVQDNHSRSARGRVARAALSDVQPQGKLVRVVAGAGVRRRCRHAPLVAAFRHAGSGSSCRRENQRMLWVPPGFAHGFLALEDGTDLLYKCTDYYAPEHDRTMLWNDPAIGIDWPLDGLGEPLVSAKDDAGMALAEADVFP